MTPAKERRPTLQTIAVRAGVSHQTVANVLNAPHKVAESTRQQVMKVIEELNYRPNETARSLARRSTKLVSFQIGDVEPRGDAILQLFTRELARTGKEFGYRVVLDVTARDDASQIASYEDLVARHAVDGVVIAATHVGDLRPRWLVEHRMPMVAFGLPWADPGAGHSWVDVDGGYGMRLVADHLVAMGHSRIAYVGHPRDRGMEDNRLDGLLDGLRAQGVQAAPGLQLLIPERERLWQDLPVFLQAQRPTAIACRDDSFALEAVQVLAELGLRPGVDIAVTGFDDSDLALRSRPQITSVAQPMKEVVRLIWESLVAQIEGSGEATIRHLAQPSLIVRASSGAPLR